MIGEADVGRIVIGLVVDFVVQESVRRSAGRRYRSDIIIIIVNKIDLPQVGDEGLEILKGFIP